MRNLATRPGLLEYSGAPWSCYRGRSGLVSKIISRTEVIASMMAATFVHNGECLVRRYEVFGTMKRFLTKAELGEDKIILATAMDSLRNEAESSDEGDRNELLFSLLEKLQKMNEHFLSLLL